MRISFISSTFGRRLWVHCRKYSGLYSTYCAAIQAVRADAVITVKSIDSLSPRYSESNEGGEAAALCCRPPADVDRIHLMRHMLKIKRGRVRPKTRLDVGRFSLGLIKEQVTLRPFLLKRLHKKRWRFPRPASDLPMIRGVDPFSILIFVVISMKLLQDGCTLRLLEGCFPLYFDFTALQKPGACEFQSSAP